MRTQEWQLENVNHNITQILCRGRRVNGTTTVEQVEISFSWLKM